MVKLYGAVETGGTKCICAVGSNPDDLADIVRFPTSTPQNTIATIVDYFSSHPRRHLLQSIGIASFGPLNLDKNSPHYGSITTTPKPNWAHTPLTQSISEQLQLPVYIDTDVNSAALSEGTWGAGKGLDTYTYITIGTGIGVGTVVHGAPIHGLIHPEGGHMLLPSHPHDPTPNGFCPYHKHCFEGLAAGPTITKRWRRSPYRLPETHKAWDIEAFYIAHALVNITMLLSPQKIIIGGGLMHRTFLYQKINTMFQTLVNGYIDAPAIKETPNTYIVGPKLTHYGLLGAILIAKANTHI